MTVEMFVIPWPHYSDDGSVVTWLLRVEAPKFHGTLKWSTKAGRFHKDNHMFRLRRGSPKVFRQAVEMMAEFCKKAAQAGEVAWRPV